MDLLIGSDGAGEGKAAKRHAFEVAMWWSVPLL